MRKSLGRGQLLAIAGAVSSLAIATAARAAIVAQEGFGEYSSGNDLANPYEEPYNHPGPQSGFTGFTDDGSGVPYGEYRATSGNLTYPSLTPINDTTPQYIYGSGGGLGVAGNIYTGTATTITSGGTVISPLFYNAGYITAGNTYVGVPGKTLYFSFLFQLTFASGSTSLTTSSAQNFLALREGTSSVLQIGQGYGASNITANGTALSSSLDTNTHLVVVGITYGATPSTDSESIYFDPNLSTQFSALTPTAVLTGAAEFNDIQLKTQGNAMNYDEFRFGNTYNDVVPGAATPEPVSLAVFSPTLVLMLKRRRRAG